MAEVLGMAAAMVGMLSQMQSITMALTEIQRRFRTTPKVEQEYLLRLEMSIQRVTLLVGTIQRLDASTTSHQELLRILETTVRCLLQFAEQVVEELSASAKRRSFFLTLKRSRVEKNLGDIEKYIDQIAALLSISATRPLYSALQETLGGILNDSERNISVTSTYGLRVLYPPPNASLEQFDVSPLYSQDAFG